jgi:protein SCO1/2
MLSRSLLRRVAVFTPAPRRVQRFLSVSSLLHARRFASSNNNGGGSQPLTAQERELLLEQERILLEQDQLLEAELAAARSNSGDDETAKVAFSQTQTRAVSEAEGLAAASQESAAVDEETKDRLAFHRYLTYALYVAVAVAFAYVANEYAKKRFRREADSTYVHVNTRGRPSLGGPFTLVSTDGEVVSAADFRGKFIFIYFGFVNCPEICPIELTRMTKVCELVKKAKPDVPLQPLFISCDPKRDSLSRIKEYLSIFHPEFIGLAGTPKQIDQVCKSYRIYYSLPDDTSAESEDYLIDHSISIMLFDQQGRFVDFWGSRYDHNEIATKMLSHIENIERDPEWTSY